jgi:hypothetical protein
MSMMFWLAALVAVVVLRPVLMWVIAHVLGGWIGRKALGQQPETIHLTRRNDLAWSNREAARALSKPLQDDGFEDAGTWGIDELAGTVVQLLVHQGDGLFACVYEHPKAGTWMELVTRYHDGRSCSFTTSPPTGLDPRPGHPVFHAPATPPNELLARALAERPQGAFAIVTPERAPRQFEEAWAEGIAWRKTHGIKTREVARVAARRRAA